MEKQTTYKRSQQGAALIFALLSILLLSVLAVAIMSTSQSQVWTSLNYRLTAQARYAAEAGVQETMAYLSSANYAPPSTADLASYTLTTNPVQYNGHPVVLSSVTTATNYYDSVAAHYSGFAGAAAGYLPNESNVSYATTATLLRMNALPTGAVSWLGGGTLQTWQITSVATITGVRSGSVQVVETFERSSAPVFNYGLAAVGTGCGAIDLAGNDYTDSYSSSAGPYSSTNSSTTGGNIAANGGISLGNSTSGGVISGGALVNGTISTALPATVGACPANGVTNASGRANPTVAELPSKLLAPLPWSCTATPCYPPATPALVVGTQDVSSTCTTISGCSKGTPTCITVACQKTTVYLNGSSSTSNGNVYTLAPNMSYGDLNITGNDVVHVTAGTYNVNSLNFGPDNGQIVIDSGPVVFNMVGNCGAGAACPKVTEPGGYMPSGWTNPQYDVIYGAGYAGFNVCAPVGGVGVVANPGDGLTTGGKADTTCGSTKSPISAIPANFQIVYGGTYLIRVGGMPNAAVTYAPLASYLSPGGAVGYYGSIITGQFADTSGSPFHYDSSLNSTALTTGQYYPAGGFSWSKF